MKKLSITLALIGGKNPGGQMMSSPIPHTITGTVHVFRDN